MKTKILGISASLRNSRFGIGSQKLVSEINSLKDKKGLKKFLKEQTKIHVNNFFEAGRGDNLPFTEIYKNLQKCNRERGLSNSEGALAAGLWGAIQGGAEIMHCNLSQYFPMSGEHIHIEELKNCILQSDALLISGPVYFGDRSSLMQELIDTLHRDKEIQEHIKNKICSGIAVGAKRNGGQETTLIYQHIDMVNLHMLVVGNDSETTSQYGGTVWAGDVGTMWEDDYGIDTSIGTGKRLARVGHILNEGKSTSLRDTCKISLWLLQDSPDKKGLGYLKQFCKDHRDDRIEFEIKDLTENKIYRCIACDICPTHLGPDEEYRCIIQSKDDLLHTDHINFVDNDAILLAAYSPADRRDIISVYQKFIERTRYLRRGDFVFSDRLVAPFVISELNANQNLHIRMLTSLIRHHTILHHPLIAIEREGQILNWDYVLKQGKSFIENALLTTTGRLALNDDFFGETQYNPLGYKISSEKFESDKKAGLVESMKKKRTETHRTQRNKRIE